MDDNTGVYQIWTAPVNIDEIGISQISVIPKDIHSDRIIQILSIRIL
ncbi:MAG: hypothetical protein R3A12_03005 [Ignavibacteria bacterium]